jgi:SSS family solute:Na+ symporter
MTFIDWSIVILLNGAVIVYALLRGRETKTSVDWFLAGKTLPFWVVGLSLYATLVDSADLIADTGGAYSLGTRLFVPNLVGVIGGWFILAHFVAVPMYRRGMYTNAEFLESRFGVGARVISVLVQVLYRTVMIGMISTAIYLMLTVVCDWESRTAWAGVVVVALVATIYTMSGGLKSVAITDALQGIVILIAAITIFFTVSEKVGGWDGLEQKINSHDPELAHQVLHIGSDYKTVIDTNKEYSSNEELERAIQIGGEYDEENGSLTRTTPAWIIILSFIIVGFAYSIVNHTQSMRLLGSKSEWHMKMAIVPAGLLLIVITYLSLGLGVMGRGIYPDPETLPGGKTDNIFPELLKQFGSRGFTGLVVAGVFAAAFSTYDSIGSTLSSLLTRDIYARLIVKDRDDKHYLAVGRWLTPLIIFGSFIYVPLLLKEGMIFTYLKVVGAFVVPLLTVYVLGTFTRVHRSSAMLALVLGVLYGLVALNAEKLAIKNDVWLLPSSFMDSYVTALVGCLVTALTMFLVSIIRGWTPREDLFIDPDLSDGWLATSQNEITQKLVSDDPVHHNFTLPVILGLLVWSIGLILTFFVFW